MKTLKINVTIEVEADPNDKEALRISVGEKLSDLISEDELEFKITSYGEDEEEDEDFEY